MSTLTDGLSPENAAYIAGLNTPFNLDNRPAADDWCDKCSTAPCDCADENTDDSEDSHRRLVVTRASEIKPRAVSWMWDGRMALGALSLLAGREGLGKSTLTAWIAARVTKGELPGHLHGKPRSVIVVATEDSWAYTLVPRFMAAGADMNRVLRVEVETAAGFTTGMNLPRDIPAVSRLVRDEGVALMVLDPLMSRLESLDTHKDAEVRIALEPLVQMADETRMAIIGLIHLNKSSTDPLNAVMGSKAFTAVARSVSTVVQDPEDEHRRLFGTVKNNLGPEDEGSEAFTVESADLGVFDGQRIITGALHWHGHAERTIKSAMSDPGVGEQSLTGEARAWLEDYLSLNPGSPRKDVMREGAKAGLSEDSIKRASRALGVVSRSEGFPRTTSWSLPAQSVHQSVQAPGESSLTAHTAPTGDDQRKRESQSVQSVQSVQSGDSPTDCAPTGAALVCIMCETPALEGDAFCTEHAHLGAA